MDVGEWVHFPLNGKKMTGFILDKNQKKLTVQVTIPDPNLVVVVDEDLAVAGCSVIWPDDIPSLIDFALMIKDKHWFTHWVHELNLWKPIDKVIAN